MGKVVVVAQNKSVISLQTVFQLFINVHYRCTSSRGQCKQHNIEHKVFYMPFISFFGLIINFISEIFIVFITSSCHCKPFLASASAVPAFA